MKAYIFLLISLVACLPFTALGSEEEPHLVLLYDALRDIYVMLTDTQVLFNQGIGSDPNGNYWTPSTENPTGAWTSCTNFTEQTGYFMQVIGVNWAEVKNSGINYFYIRIQPGEVVKKSLEKYDHHVVVLYDSSRDMYVMLTETQAFFNEGITSDPDSDAWSLIGENPNGVWASDTHFNEDTGYFEQTQGDNWVENKTSGLVHNFVRVQPGEVVIPKSEVGSSNCSEHQEVILYDTSRDIYVKLTDTQVFYNWGYGSDPTASYWELIEQDPTGAWTSCSHFSDQTGYFEQTQGDNWIETLNTGTTHNFTRVN